jgi:hypothetical protein
MAYFKVLPQHLPGRIQEYPLTPVRRGVLWIAVYEQ